MHKIPQRKYIRLIDYDYSQNGAYFVTLCIHNKHKILWNDNKYLLSNELKDNLSYIGIITERAINNINKIYININVDNYVIMPNHIHMILVISDFSGRTLFAPTIHRVIKQMKEHITKTIGLSIWQKSFYDHIIRNDTEYQEIYKYIDNNPLEWELDKYYC